MSDFALMMEAGSFLPTHVRIWVMWMQLLLFLAPLIFFRQLGAQLLLGAQVLNVMVAYFVFVSSNNTITHLFGLGHVFWIVPLWVLLRERKIASKKSYRIYATLAVLTIFASLVLDTRGAILWAIGERGGLT